MDIHGALRRRTEYVIVARVRQSHDVFGLLRPVWSGEVAEADSLVEAQDTLRRLRKEEAGRIGPSDYKLCERRA